MRIRAWTGHIAIVGALYLCVWAVARDVPESKQGTPQLEISSTVMDFGEVWQCEPAIGAITLKNVGDAPLRIINVKTSCGCATPSRPKCPLLPGESDVLTITYDTVKRRGPARQRVTLTTNDPSQPRVEITVRGNVKPLYEATPSDMLIFARINRDEHKSQTIKLKNKYEGPLKLKLKDGQDFGPFEITFKEIRPGQEFELAAKTNPPMPDGVSRIGVLLETGLPNTNDLYIPVQVNVQPDVVCRPCRLRANQLAIVPMKLNDVRLIYRADKPVKIIDVYASHEGFEIEVMPPTPERGNRAWFQQRIHVTAPPGDLLPPEGAVLEILTDSRDPRFQSFSVTIDVVDPRAARRARTQVKPEAVQSEEDKQPEDHQKP